MNGNDRASIARQRDGRATDAERGGDSIVSAEVRALMANSFDAMLVTDRFDRIVEANLAAARVFGQPLEALIGRRVRDLIKRHRGTDASTATITWEHGDGSLLDVVVRDVLGVVPGMTVRIVHDLGAESATARALEQKSRLLKEAQSVGNIGAWELDVTTGLLGWSPELRRLMEVPETCATLTIEESYDFYTQSSRAIVREAFDVTLSRGTPYDLELEVVTGRGNRIWVREVCRPVMRRGKLVSLIGISQDITERRRLTQLLAEVASNERARLGADLHDGVGQELAGLALMLESLATRTGDSDAGLSRELRTLSRLASNAVGTVRAVAHGMLPVEIGDGGLIGALQRLARSMSAAFGVAVSVRFLGDRLHMPDGPTAEHLYRIAQEATTNAAKHGRAKRVSLLVQAGENKTLLSATDDGRGVDPRGKRDGMGLEIMRYRVRMLGGLFDVQSVRTGGTRVRCIVPRNGHAQGRPAPGNPGAAAAETATPGRRRQPARQRH